jgi:type I restriction enzyme S subunit
MSEPHGEVTALWPTPASWVWTVVSGVGSVALGRQRSPANHNGPNMHPYVRAANITCNGWDFSDVKEMNFDDADFARFHLCPGDVLVNEGSGSAKEVGKPAIWEGQIENCCFQNTLIRVQPQGCTSEFLHSYFLFSALTERFVSKTQGVNIYHIGKDGLANFPIPVPPADEQRRIVAKIDSLSGKSKRAHDHLEHIPRLVEKYRQAILKAAFRGDLTGDRNGFDRCSLGTLASLVTKGASPRWQGFEYVDDGILFIRSQNVGWGKLILEDRAYLPPEFETKHRRSMVRANDVLLNIVGASIGRAAVATPALEGANCNQAVAIIRLLETNPASKFVCHWLLSAEAQSAIASGTVDFARANFSLGDIRNLQLPWPPAEKRDEIVRRIDGAFAWIDRLAAEATNARSLIDHLDKAVLDKAFRGELVPQDPSDEPASVLLERIKAGRATASGANMRRARRTRAGSTA